MLTKLRTFVSLYRELGVRWSAFRVAYALRLRTGLIRLQMPQYKWTDRPLETWLKKDVPSEPEAYAKWRKQNSPRFFFGLENVMLSDSEAFRTSGVESLHYRSGSHVPWNPQTTIEEASRILSGEIKYFAHEFRQTGFPPNWHQDPVSGIELDSKKHWSQISDDNVTASRSWFSPKQSPRNRRLLRREVQEPSSQRHLDIKFIWEANRFSFVYTLVRAHAASQDEKYAEAYWKLILDWAEHNLPNTGANWKDGQEISLRLMAWTFGYYQFSHSPSATPQRISQFTQYVAAQAERIYKNIDYAISTRSNHTISEAFGLWLVGLLFPELKNAEKYLSIGKKLLEEEAVRQILPDGSYSMYSLNYHRFILHIYLYAIRLAELNNSRFPDSLYSSISASTDYHSHLIDHQTGQMPVYGSNDGALVLSLNNCDFTDYRPLLQLGSFITKGDRLFEIGEWDEDIYWLCGEELPSPIGRGVRGAGGLSFPHGGTYLLHNSNSKAIIRCTDFRARPSHADQLHVDLWIHGQNIACDAGTYLYSGEGIWRNGLARTSVHNTVTVDGKDQMTMVSRFTWTNWSRGKVIKHNEKIWQGEHDGYKPGGHRRTIMTLEDDRWLVIDHLVANEPHHYVLHWLLNDFPYEQKNNSILLSLNEMKYRVQVGMTHGNGNLSLVRADPNSTRGWRSKYYGHKEPALSVMLEANQPQVSFWSFFGFENDVVEVDGESLNVNSKKIMLVE